MTIIQMNKQFTFSETGSHAAILYNGMEILHLDKNCAFFNGYYMIRNQVMVPGGVVENAFVPVFSAYPPKFTVVDVEYQLECDGERLRLRILPLKSTGKDCFYSGWREEVVFEVHLERGVFVWRQETTLTFLENYDLSDPRLNSYRMHHQDGRPGYFYQFADPVPAGGSGPAVPMQRDWLGFLEPYNGPDTFRKHWKRNYRSIIFENPDHTFSWSELNKIKWLHLTADNRRARPCASSGVFYLVKDSGDALEYHVDAPSHYHHVCEWGMDFHCWADLAEFAKNSEIPGETQISCTTIARLVGQEIVSPILSSAKEIALSEEERAAADRPCYEEPENTFAVSALERPDGQYWEPTSEGCAWNRNDGYEPGHGALVIENHYCTCGSWEQRLLGPSNWGNPFVPGVRYRLSAWVRVKRFLPDPSLTFGPQVGVDFIQYNGPASGATTTAIECGWSPPVINSESCLQNEIEWTRIEFVTPPCSNYVLRAVLKLRLSGRGKAFFSKVRWELADDNKLE